MLIHLSSVIMALVFLPTLTGCVSGAKGVGVSGNNLFRVENANFSISEDQEAEITLRYDAPDEVFATACAIYEPTELNITESCHCDDQGVCKVKLRPSTSHYFGNASFQFQFTHEEATSKIARATVTIESVDDIPTTSDMAFGNRDQNTEHLLTLTYTDIDSVATSCTISNPQNLTVTTPCSCINGSCRVGVTSSNNYLGAAQFDFSVTSLSQTSNVSTASMSFIYLNRAPVASNISPAAFDEDVESIITLSYTDAENDLATSCQISNLNSVTISTPCSCSAGTCTVGITSEPNMNGSASFQYRVTATGGQSNLATATLTLNSVDDVTVVNAITDTTLIEDTAKTLTLSYSDVDGDEATACSLSALSNITITTACSCTGGTCTVGVRGTSNYNGAASASYSLTVNGSPTSSANITLSIAAVDDPPTVTAVSTPSPAGVAIPSFDIAYSDPEGDSATACSVSVLNGTGGTLSSSCSCSAGSCTVGISPAAGYVGAMTLETTVTANSAQSASVNLIVNLNCPTGYIRVPSDSNLSLGDFCVMQTEAQNQSGSAGTGFSAGPWNNINLTDAFNACSVLGSKFALMSNQEAQAIANNVENQPSNWSNNAVGIGTLPIGHSDSTPNRAVVLNGNTDAWYDTGDTSVTKWNQRRTLNLSTGDTIWDFAGNVSEWVDWDHLTPGLQTLIASWDFTPINSTAGRVYGVYEFSSLDTFLDLSSVIKPKSILPIGPYNSSHGTGQYIPSTSSAVGAPQRGGHYTSGSINGIYSFTLNASGAELFPQFGFRCVYRP